MLLFKNISESFQNLSSNEFSKELQKTNDRKITNEFIPRVGSISLDYNNINKKNESKFLIRVRSMFRAVILQGYIDLRSNFKRTEDMIAKCQAFEWFNVKNENFINVCYLAQYSERQIIKEAKFFKKIAEKQINEWHKKREKNKK